jgi:hypothetical protein
MLALMGAGERVVARRMPVLGEDNVLEEWRDAMNDRDDSISVGDSKGPAGTEIILYIDDEQNILVGDRH